MPLKFGLLILKMVQVKKFKYFNNIIGSVKKGKEGKADSTFSMLDDDLFNMANGKLNP